MKAIGCALAVLAALALVLPAASQTHGTQPPPATGAPTGTAPSILTIDQMPTGDGRINLMARLVGVDQKALGNQTIEFELIADFFGERPVPIGSAVTMATGQAMFPYKPVSADEKIRARFLGSAANAAASIEFRVSPDPNAAAPAASGHAARPLAPVWQMTAWAAAIVSTAIWLVLIGVVASVWRGLKRDAPGANA